MKSTKTKDKLNQQSSNILEIKQITKTYGKLVANDDISFNIKASTIHALLGENGAGKSTLVKILYGSLSADQGEMLWQGEKYEPKNPRQARAQGIAKVFQHFSLFESLTVAENIALGLDEVKVTETFKKKIIEYSKQYGLKIEPNQVVGNLSVGERQRIEIFRCLMQNPKLLIMDEPTSVLTPQEVKMLFATLNQLVAEGCTILYISHKLDEVRELCQAATILRQGKLVATCEPKKTSKHELIEMMLDKKFINPSREETKLGEVILKVENLNQPSDELFGVDLKNINVSLRRGSITGIAGVAGNGQDELMEVLTGEKLSASGFIKYFPLGEGEEMDISRFRPNERRHQSIFFTPEKRLGHATVEEMSLRENMLISRPEKSGMTATGKVGKIFDGWIKWSRVNELANQVISDFNVVAQSSESLSKSLSGGNLQKYIIGREVVQKPEVFIINQPTWGVDAGSAGHIHQNIIRLADQGVAVLVISQDLDEILFLCDQIQVLANGRLSEALDGRQVDMDKLGQYMLEGQE